MKTKLLVGLVCLSAVLAPAQDNELEAVKRQLKEATEAFQKAMEQQRQVIESLTKKVNQLEVQQTGISNVLAKPEALPMAADPNVPFKKGWSPTDPIRISKGAAYAELGLIGTFAAGSSTAKDIENLQPGGHDPSQRGFTIQGIELNLQGAVDPYFRGKANILFSIDAGGESFLEVEEAWLETMSLPWNLQVRAGQMLTDFGRLNTQHPHAWAFVDTSLVNARLLGADGLRNPGARLSWLAPTPFFTELSLGIQNSHGETASSFRSAGHSHGGEEEEEGLPFGYRHPDNDRGIRQVDDMLFTPRLATSFDLTDAQTLVLGASAAFGPNSSGGEGDTSTQIYGVDAYWKWKPVNHHSGFPFVLWQTEAMVRRYELGAFDWDEDGDGAVSDGEVANAATGLPASLKGETVTDWGFYSQVLYGFHKGWVAGVRGDFVTGERGDYERLPLTLDGARLGRDPLREERWRVSPNLTWFPTEFSKLRLQYNYDHRRQLGEDHSLWLQFEFLLGAHGAHKF